MAEYIVFVDTNIFLDSYRSRSDAALHLLKLIDQHHDRIITTCQVEMEFKKNRQEVILASLGNLKHPQATHAVPALFRDAKAVAAAKKSIERAGKMIKSLQDRIKKVLANPTTHDPVYQIVQRLHRKSSPLNLDRTNEQRFAIRRLARKRFLLGYPPRKNKDTSIGDAINWEWIVECASEHRKNVIIVSRDSDYGATLDGDGYLNDWLLQEFRERVGRKHHVRLTTRLTDAFKMANVKVSKKQEDEEKSIIAQRMKEKSDAQIEWWRQFFSKKSDALIQPWEETEDNFEGPDYADLEPPFLDESPPDDDGPPDDEPPPDDDGPPDDGGPPDDEPLPEEFRPPDIDLSLGDGVPPGDGGPH